MIRSSKVLFLGLCAGGLMTATSVASAGTLYNNGSASGSGHEAANSQHADDFVLAFNSNVTGATISIFEINFNAWDGTLKYYLYSNNVNKPGTLLTSGTAQNIVETFSHTSPSGWIFSNVEFDFQSSPLLNAGETYWLGIHMSNVYGDGDQVNWAGTTSGLVGNRSKRSFLGTGPWSNNFFDFSFSIQGNPVPAPGAVAMLALGGLATMRRRRS